MISQLLNWFNRRKQIKAKDRYEEGYGYAMTQHFLYGADTSDLCAEVDMAETFGEVDDFDRGIVNALASIHRINTGQELVKRQTRTSLCEFPQKIDTTTTETNF